MEGFKVTGFKAWVIKNTGASGTFNIHLLTPLFNAQSLLARSKCHTMDCTYHFPYLTGDLYGSSDRAELQGFFYNAFGEHTIGHIFSRLSPGLLFANTIHIYKVCGCKVDQFCLSGLQPQRGTSSQVCTHNSIVGTTMKVQILTVPLYQKADHLKIYPSMFYPGTFNSHFDCVILWALTISPHLLFFSLLLSIS